MVALVRSELKLGGTQPGDLEDGYMQGVEKLHHPQWMKGGKFLADKGGTNTERRTLKNPVVLG